MGTRDGDEVVWALSETDGKEVWVARLGPVFAQGMPQSKEGPGCTPTVDGDRLYALGMGGTLACLQVSDGKVLWQLNLVTDFGGVVPTWSYRESPLVDGGKLICTPGGGEATVVALDKMTGKTLWNSRMSGGAEAGSAAPAGAGAPRGSGDPAASLGAGAPGAIPAAGVTGTQDPALFQSERFGMRTFSSRLPNGKHLAKLYFAETYEGITRPGQRVFTLNAQGKELKDFDIWTKAGGPRRAYVETVPVEVTDGEFRIVFTPQVENPAIKAIEVIPQPADGAGASQVAAVRIKAGLATAFTDSSGQVWQHGKPPRWRGAGRWLSLRFQRRQWRRVPHLPRFRDRRGAVERARQRQAPGAQGLGGLRRRPAVRARSGCPALLRRPAAGAVGRPTVAVGTRGPAHRSPGRGGPVHRSLGEGGRSRGLPGGDPGG